MIAAYKNRITGALRERDFVDGTGVAMTQEGEVTVSEGHVLSSDWEPLYTLEEARKILLEMAR